MWQNAAERQRRSLFVLSLERVSPNLHANFKHESRQTQYLQERNPARHFEFQQHGVTTIHNLCLQ